MQIFGFQVSRAKSTDLVTRFPADFPIGPTDGWWSRIIEPFTGAWQRNIVASLEQALVHPTFWSCVTLIANDIAKGRFQLVRRDDDDITSPTTSTAFSPVLRRPNHYQNRIQFTQYWITSKLCRGNAYALKERDDRNVVRALYPLDPSRVRPLQSPSGDVYYALGHDQLSGIGPDDVVVPASEIIHDRMNAVYHPLVGLSPIYASGQASLQALRVMDNTSRLTQQGFQPGGVITAAEPISEDNAKKFEAMFQTQYGGPDNAGKFIFLGGGLKFEKPPVMSAVDAQLIQQLDWDDLKICQTFHVPPYMVGVGPAPTYNNIEALLQQYHSLCLQILIEEMELCLEEGLGVLDAGFEIEHDIGALLRMDTATKMKTATDGVKGGVYTPNEGRKVFNKKPLKGGDTVYFQEQDHALEWLADRDAEGPPPLPALPAAPDPPALPPATKSYTAKELSDAALKKLAA